MANGVVGTGDGNGDAESLATSVESSEPDGRAVVSLWHPEIEVTLSKSAPEIAKDASIFRVSNRDMFAFRRTSLGRYGCNDTDRAADRIGDNSICGPFDVFPIPLIVRVDVAPGASPRAAHRKNEGRGYKIIR